MQPARKLKHKFQVCHQAYALFILSAKSNLASWFLSGRLSRRNEVTALHPALSVVLNPRPLQLELCFQRGIARPLPEFGRLHLKHKVTALIVYYSINFAIKVPGYPELFLFLRTWA